MAWCRPATALCWGLLWSLVRPAIGVAGEPGGAEARAVMQRALEEQAQLPLAKPRLPAPLPPQPPAPPPRSVPGADESRVKRAVDHAETRSYRQEAVNRARAVGVDTAPGASAAGQSRAAAAKKAAHGNSPKGPKP